MTFEAFRNLFGLLAVPAIGGLFWWINRVDMAAARSLWKGPNQGGTRRQAGDYGRRDPARLEGLRRQGRAADAQLLAHEAAKQALRDIPNGQDGTDAQCDAATTPADLQAIWPAEL